MGDTLDNIRGSGQSAAGAIAGDTHEQRATTKIAVEKTAKWVLEGLFWLKCTALSLTVVFVLVEIFARYVLNSSVGSTENVLVLLFMWMIFLSLPGAAWNDEAPRVTVFRDTKAGRLSRHRSDLIVGVEAAYYIYIVISYVATAGSQFSIKLQPLSWDQITATIPIPVGCGIALLMVCGKRLTRKIGLASLVSALAGAGAVVVILVAFGGTLAAGVALLGILLGLGAPIAISLGIGAVAMIGVTGGLLAVPSAQLLSGASNVALLALPLFMLMGGLISKTRLSNGLAQLVRSLVGWLPGGVGVADILASGIFANMTGNSSADTAAMGTVFIPQMVGSDQFTSAEAAGVQAAAGAIGVIFPPAITMIIFSSITASNVVTVFKAVVIPALLLLSVMALVTMYRKRHSRREPGGLQFGAVVRSVPAALPVLLVPIILDVGIFSGVFAPFESGAVAVAIVGAFLVMSRRISRGELREAFTTAFHGMTLAMFILVNVSILNYGLTTSGASSAIASFSNSAGTSKWVVLIVINIIFLLVHTMVDVIASILVFVPLVLPAVVAAHISVYQLAAIIGINSTIGVILPPLGIGLYVSSGIAKVDAAQVVRRIWPYVISSLLVLILVSAVPALSLTL